MLDIDRAETDAEIDAILDAPKKCSKCGSIYPTEQFEVATSRKYSWRRGWCKECLRAYYREYYQRKKAMKLMGRKP